MKIGIQKVGPHKNQSSAIISHKDKTLEWGMKFIDKANLTPDVDIFEQINAYWLTLTEEHQGRIFAVYTRIRSAFNDCWEDEDLPALLKPLIAELTDLHNLDKIRYWVDFKSDLKLPARLDDTFVEQHQTSYTRDKTYLKEDYQQLVALSIAIRVLIPIWGAYIERTEGDAGTQWKEFKAYQLLEKSDLMKSPPMVKLMTYVDRNVNTDKVNTVSILKGGVSSVDMPGWVTGLVVVRRLGFGDIRGINPLIHLVTQISGFIGTVMSGQESRFKSAGMIKPKIIEGQGSSDSESNLSKLEGVKVKESVAAGTIVAIDVFTDNPMMIAKKISPSIDPLLVRMSLESTKVLNDEDITPVQRTLIQLVISPVVSTRGSMYLNHLKLVKMMAVAQAILWHKGFHDLALLVSAIPKSSNTISGMEGRGRIPKELIDQLAVLYPYSRPQSGKKTDKGKNTAVAAIELIEEDLSKNDWRPTLPKEWLDKLPQNQSTQTYRVPYEIKTRLAEFSICLAKKEF